MKCRRVGRLSAGVLATALGILESRTARADFPLPVNLSGGPQVAWSWGRTRGPSVGWEGGGGLGIILRLNFGQTLGREYLLSYAVAEPYTLYVGGTLGVGYDRENKWSRVLGVWEGVPIVYPNACGLPQPGRSSSDFGFLLTLAVGYRNVGGGHQVYLTPKAGIAQSAYACSSSAGANSATCGSK